MRLFVIGFMGAGKTTYGAKLARNLNSDFIDLDDYIVSIVGKSIHQIFNDEGEKHFRSIEAEKLRLFGAVDNVVISLGGGTPCFHDNMKWLNDHGVTIYLKLDSMSIFSRLNKAKAERPLVSDKSKSEILEYIKTTLSEREKFYEQANIVVEAKNLNSGNLAKIVKDYLALI